MAFALITGGSKGIGKEIAIQLASKGYDLLLVSRSLEELSDTKNEIESQYKSKVFVKSVDLSHPNGAEIVYNWVKSESYQIQILVNNAGYGLWGFFQDLSLESQQNMLQLNVNCLVDLTYKMLPILKSNSQSYIMNVASTAAYQAVPSLAVYAGSKSFVVLFTRGLRFELKNTSVSVTCLSPGATATNFTSRAGMQAMQAVADKFNMNADEVAKIAVNGMFSKKSEIIPGFTNWISVMATYFLPKILIESIAANLYLKYLKK